MNRAILVALAVPALAGRAIADDDPAAPHFAPRAYAALAGYSLYLATEYGFKADLAADRCRWCDPPGFDRATRDALVWDDTALARRISDLTGYPGTTLLAAGLFAISAESPRHFLGDLLTVGETIAYVQVATNAVKFLSARQRPYAHFTPGTVTPGPEDNLSFFSGHTSFAFSAAFAAGAVASYRRYRLAPVIWAGTLALAATTGYLRIAGDRHYLSDVVVGAGVAAAAAYGLPRLTRSLGASVVPTRDGVAIVATF